MAFIKNYGTEDIFEHLSTAGENYLIKSKVLEILNDTSLVYQ